MASTHTDSTKLDDNEVLENRRKLAEKIGNTRTGGKGTVRRKHKVAPKTSVNDDKKLKTIVKKLGVQPLQAIDEVNMFKDDGSVLHFKNPEVLAAVQSNTFVIIGKGESKNVNELMPEILTHLGPKQVGLLKNLFGNMAKKTNQTIKEEKEDDDVPELVSGANFEEKSKEN